MSKRHFDLAPLLGRTLERLSSLQRPHMLTFGFKQVARDDPLCSFSAARLQCAGSAILGARPIGHSAVLAYHAAASELFSCRTDKRIGLQIKGEVGAGEEAFGLMLAVEQRNVGLDPVPHQPAD